MTASEGPVAGARVLRVHGPSRLAFTGTTLALVTLATLATAALVSESTPSVPGSAVPGLALPPVVTGGDGIVVDRVPGTWAPQRRATAATVVDALLGGAGSGQPPTTTGVSLTGVSFAGVSFAGTGVLRGTAGIPVAVPVAVSVARPVVRRTPSIPAQPKAPDHVTSPAGGPNVPSVIPSTVTDTAGKHEKAAKRDEQGRNARQESGDQHSEDDQNSD